jgi:Arc/MetJ-type ribon-helix-helix transcriptional regulator
MLLFEEQQKGEEEDKESKLVTVKLDDEHTMMLKYLVDSGAASKGDAIRQCIRLGFKQLKDKTGPQPRRSS